ncbi:hypothetical protein D3C86_2162350 [compost metagenome]
MQHRLNQIVQQLINRRLLVAGGQKRCLGLDRLTQLLIVQAIAQRLLGDHAQQAG